MPRSLVLVLFALACRNPRAQPPQPPQREAASAATAAGPAPAPKPEARVDVVELDTSKPTHRVLAWLLNVLGKRNGIVERGELEQYVAKKMLGPTGVERGLPRWAEESAGAVVVKLDVDDATYVRAFVFAGGKRWRFILEVDTAGRLVFIQRDPVQ